MAGLCAMSSTAPNDLGWWNVGVDSNDIQACISLFQESSNVNAGMAPVDVSYNIRSGRTVLWRYPDPTTAAKPTITVIFHALDGPTYGDDNLPLVWRYPRVCVCAGSNPDQARILPPDKSPPNGNLAYQAVYQAVRYFQQYDTKCDLYIWVGATQVSQGDAIWFLFDYVTQHLLDGDGTDGQAENYKKSAECIEQELHALARLDDDVEADDASQTFLAGDVRRGSMHSKFGPLGAVRASRSSDGR